MNNEYRKELILDKRFKEYLIEYCEVFGYDKCIATRIYNSLLSNNFINKDTTVFDFVSGHDRVEINSTICFHNMGEKCYIVLINAIKALNIPLKNEPGYKLMFTNYNKYLERNKGKSEEIEKQTYYGKLEDELEALKNQLNKNKKLLSELIILNKELDERIDYLMGEVDISDGEKHR